MKYQMTLLLLLVVSGCATDIDYKIPVHRFMDPETRGASLFHGEISAMGQLSFQSDHKVTMTEVFDFGVFGTSVNEGVALSRTHNFGIQGALGVIPSVDLHLRNNGDSPLMVIGKWQFLGGSSQEAQQGFKMSVWGGVGSMDEDEGTLTVSNNTDTETYSGKIEVSPWEVGLSFGQRFNPAVIVYANAVYAQYPSTSTLTQSNDVLKIKGEALLESIVLGAKFGDHRLACHLEVGASRVSWKNAPKLEQEIGTLGLALSFGF